MIATNFRQSSYGIALAALMALTPFVVSAEPISIVDEGGYHATFDGPVKRIVALNRYNTEFVRAVAGSDAVVGLDRDAWNDRDYWPEIDDSKVVAAKMGRAQA